MYEYRARVVRVIDGDTLAVSVDCGLDVSVNLTVRLYGINCPEMKGETREAGELARDFTIRWVMEHDSDDRDTDWGWFTLHTYKDKKEKYGRYLATILPLGATARSLNGSLLDAGHAEVADYR